MGHLKRKYPIAITKNRAEIPKNNSQDKLLNVKSKTYLLQMFC